jgi:hypothetical protein
MRKTQFFKDRDIYNVVSQLTRLPIIVLKELGGNHITSGRKATTPRLRHLVEKGCPALRVCSLVVDFPVAKGWAAFYTERRAEKQLNPSSQWHQIQSISHQQQFPGIPYLLMRHNQ